MRKIYIPHLHYTINIKKFVPDPDAPHAKAYTVSSGSNSCDIFLPKGRHSPGDIAHELIHALQLICLHRDINFVTEQEHMAYLMHYLMGQMLGYSWK